MPYSLLGRSVLITGGSRGLGAEVARKFAAEGSNIAINYANNEAPAQELAKEIQQKHNVKTVILKGDGGNMADCTRCVQDTIKAFGGLDIMILNAGWTKFSDFADLSSMTDDEWDRCWHTNVMGPKKYVEVAMPTFKKNEEGGVAIITSSIAGQSIGGSSMPYSITKSAQIHMMKCVAKTQGPKLRINAVLPGLLLTDWGNLYSEERIKGLKEASALKKTTDVSECADMYISIAKNTSITGQDFSVDSGLNVAKM